MRTANYRDDVLWAIANRLGLDPTKNLLDDQADALAVYINERVRRAYPATDWPEWTETVEKTPDAFHVVSWSSLGFGTGTLRTAERVFKVFLLDPRANPGATDIPFRLTPAGVHVGFNHGPTVWIKFINESPRFTASKWRGDVTYAANQLVYSSRTGNCYKSKAQNNIGNDPADDDTNELVQLETSQVQAFTPDNPGLTVQPEIFKIFFTEALLPPDPPDPPPSGTVFSFAFVDQDNNTLGLSFVTATGSQSMADIINATAALLVGSLPGSFTVTADTTAQTITLQDESYFTAAAAFYRSTDDVTHNLRAKITQNFIPGMSSTPGQPQQAQLSLTVADVRFGATYTLKVIQQDGTAHTAEYVALTTDSAAQILAGLVAAADGSSDAYFQNLTFLLDPTLLTLIIGSPESVSVEASMAPPGSSWWQRVDFPMDLVETVVEGAYGDALKEGGQNDKAAPQVQQSGQEQTNRQGSILRQSADALTDQQRPRSRYRIQ